MGQQFGERRKQREEPALPDRAEAEWQPRQPSSEAAVAREGNLQKEMTCFKRQAEPNAGRREAENMTQAEVCLEVQFWKGG